MALASSAGVTINKLHIPGHSMAKQPNTLSHSNDRRQASNHICRHNHGPLCIEHHSQSQQTQPARLHAWPTSLKPTSSTGVQSIPLLMLRATVMYGCTCQQCDRMLCSVHLTRCCINKAQIRRHPHGHRPPHTKRPSHHVHTRTINTRTRSRDCILSRTV